MSRGRKLLITSSVLAVSLTLLAGFGVWYVLIRDDSPPPVSLEAAVAQLEASAATATDAPATGSAEEDVAPSATVEATATEASEAASPTTESFPTATAAPADAAASTWTVAVAAESFVGYRIDEELASIGATTAVGRTAEVSGSLVLEGTAVTEVTIEANMQTLTSDEERRDNALRNQSLETATFPSATFTLTAPIELSEALTEGALYSVVATGDLTIHGVTRAVELPLEAQYTNGMLVVVGSLEIALADFEISQPSAPAVVSVSDTATMEIQLYFATA